MKELMFAVVIGVVMGLQAAPDPALQAAANDPAVAQMAASDPDGCQLFAAKDGSMKVVSVGTGVYDFNDADDVRDAHKEATRAAKAHIVKFFKENFATAEQAENASKKAKSMYVDGTNESYSVSKEQVKTVVETVRSDANKILCGVVVLKDEKIPSGARGGTVRVTVGVSSTTMAVAAKVSNEMTDRVSEQDNHKPRVPGAPQSSTPNTHEVRVSKGVF